MPKSHNRKRGYKAFDPYCTDKVRIALYKRPNGPHMGKLVLGKTHLSGLDDKCFSRTGRIKKGYRNVPFSAEREFAIEKRQLEEIDQMLHSHTKRSHPSYANSRNNESLPPKKPQLSDDDDNSDDDHNSDNDSDTKMESKNLVNTADIKAAIQPRQKGKKQKTGLCQRMPNESIAEFIRRVKRTENAALAELNRKETEKRLRKKEKQQEKALAKQPGGKEIIKMRTDAYENSRQRRRAKEKRIRNEKKAIAKLEESSKPQKEKIEFGETNYQPPQFQECDFMKRSKKKKKRFLMQNFNSGERKVNVDGLSFADTIRNRAKELELERIKQNYNKMKVDRRQKELKRVWKAKKAKQRMKN